MRFKHQTLVYFSGALWFLIGTFLLYTGLNLLTGAIKQPLVGAQPIIDSFEAKETVCILLIALGLIVGYGKGRFILGKSANRVANRIKSFPSPVSILHMYSLPYWILIGSMMGLGMGIKYLGIPVDIRGTVDVAIGSALINGALIFFRLGGSLSAATCGSSSHD